MGQKVHPTGIRLGIVKDWASKWYADSQTFPEYVKTDHDVRVFIKQKLKDASVSRISIERPAKKANITIHTARPGIVIGKKGEDIEKLRAEVAQMIGMSITDVRININEVRKPELDAQLVAEGIAQQLQRLDTLCRWIVIVLGVSGQLLDDESPYLGGCVLFRECLRLSKRFCCAGYVRVLRELISLCSLCCWLSFALICLSICPSLTFAEGNQAGELPLFGCQSGLRGFSSGRSE